MVDKKALLNKQRLKNAFEVFDADGSGKISYKEVKMMLTNNCKQEISDDVF